MPVRGGSPRASSPHPCAWPPVGAIACGRTGLTRGTHTRGMETYDSEFEHTADLVLVILCVAGGMLMWQTHGWLMAVSSIMFAAGGTLLVFHWGAVHMRRMGEDGR